MNNGLLKGSVFFQLVEASFLTKVLRRRKREEIGLVGGGQSLQACERASKRVKKLVR